MPGVPAPPQSTRLAVEFRLRAPGWKFRGRIGIGVPSDRCNVGCATAEPMFEPAMEVSTDPKFTAPRHQRGGERGTGESDLALGSNGVRGAPSPTSVLKCLDPGEDGMWPLTTRSTEPPMLPGRLYAKGGILSGLLRREFVIIADVVDGVRCTV